MKLFINDKKTYHVAYAVISSLSEDYIKTDGLFCHNVFELLARGPFCHSISELLACGMSMYVPG